MNGARSFVVLTSGGEQGLQVVRHPSHDEERALSKAEEMSQANPGQAFYVAEVYVKVLTPVAPAPQYIRLA